MSIEAFAQCEHPLLVVDPQNAADMVAEAEAEVVARHKVAVATASP